MSTGNWRLAAILAVALSLLVAIVASARGQTASSWTTYVPYIPNVRASATPLPTATLTPTPTPRATATITATWTASPTPTPTMDGRFGVIVTGIGATSALNALGLTYWYSYGASTPGTPGVEVAQISVAGTQVPATTLQAAARQFPGSYWIIGNEPNVPGQDNVSGDYYATQLEYYVTTIKGADPTAQIVGPNVLNWDYTCSGCYGYTSGHTWVDSFRSSWASLYGGEPPIDVWSLHAYPISWDSLPMTNATIVEQQITGFSAYLGAISADQAKPIWLTEFGVIWGYDGYQGVSTGCAQGSGCIAPTGSFDTTAVTSYLNTLLPWFASAGPSYRLNRWFLYTTIGSPEPYATTYTGISLLNADGTLTSFGQLYRQDATTQ
jgi:hypothetical protein